MSLLDLVLLRLVDNLPSFSNMHSQQTFDLLTVSSLINTEMNTLPGNIPNNYNKMRDRISLPKTQYSRALYLFSTKFSITYHKKIELNNTINKDVEIDDNFP